MNKFTLNQRQMLQAIYRASKTKKPLRWRDFPKRGHMITLASLERRGAIERFAGKNDAEITLTAKGKIVGLVI